MRVVLDADPHTEQAEIVQELAQLQRRPGIRLVGPDHDRLDQGGMTGLAKVCGTGEQREVAGARQHQALEEAVAERVVAGEPVVALRREQQQRIELAARHVLQHARAPRLELLRLEMQRHSLVSRLAVRLAARADP
jgi:hypothetical protein